MHTFSLSHTTRWTWRPWETEIGNNFGEASMRLPFLSGGERTVAPMMCEMEAR